MGDGLGIIIYPVLFVAGAFASIALWVVAWFMLPKWKRDRSTVAAAGSWKDYAFVGAVLLIGAIFIFAFMPPAMSWEVGIVGTLVLLSPAAIYVGLSAVEKQHNPRCLLQFILIGVGVTLACLVALGLTTSSNRSLLESSLGIFGIVFDFSCERFARCSCIHHLAGARCCS